MGGWRAVGRLRQGQAGWSRPACCTGGARPSKHGVRLRHARRRATSITRRWRALARRYRAEAARMSRNIWALEKEREKYAAEVSEGAARYQEVGRELGAEGRCWIGGAAAGAA